MEFHISIFSVNLYRSMMFLSIYNRIGPKSRRPVLLVTSSAVLRSWSWTETWFFKHWFSLSLPDGAGGDVRQDWGTVSFPRIQVFMDRAPIYNVYYSFPVSLPTLWLTFTNTITTLPTILIYKIIVLPSILVYTIIVHSTLPIYTIILHTTILIYTIIVLPTILTYTIIVLSTILIYTFVVLSTIVTCKIIVLPTVLNHTIMVLTAS